MTCSAYVTLGRVRTSPSGRPCGLQQAGEEDVEGADAPVAHRRLHALHADAHVRGRCALGVRLSDQPGGAGGGLVLLGVRARPVAVLEVDAQVFDRLALQLGADAVVHGPGEVVAEAEDGGEGGGVGGVLVEGGEGPVTPGAEGVGGEDVTGDVDGVHGLAGARVTRVAALQLRVDGGEGGADLLADGARETRRHVLLPLCPIPHPPFSALRNQESV